ncbi:MAG: hypothetical protein VZS44_05595 [Bacilli bacterium]|nr:hypothetical protein [Bacilli bacterium]
MIKQKFIIKEEDLLKNIKGNKLEKIYYTEPVFGKIKLDFSDYAIIISNEMHKKNLIGDYEDITYFTIDKVDKEYDFSHFENDNTVKNININEKIISIKIVNDLINYNDEYEISYDEAIVFITDEHDYIISRDWFYMETMEINIDKDIDDILNKDTIKEQYRGEETNIKVDINRTNRDI